MRESITQRRDTVVVAEDGRESTTPVEPTVCGLGGELHDNVNAYFLHCEQESIMDSKKDNDKDSKTNITVVYNTRL